MAELTPQIKARINFKTRFFEMLGIALGVATLNFFIGLAVKRYFNVDL